MENSDIDKLVKASIETKIIEAFRKTPEMIDELVKGCLRQDVNQHGGTEIRYSDTKMPYLTYLARNAVQEVAMKAVYARVAEIEPEINEAVRTALSGSDIADAFTQQILAATKDAWRIKVSFAADKD